MKSMMKVDEINGKSIVFLSKANHLKWVVARDFDDSKPEGSKWSSGQYFASLYEAVSYAKGKNTLYKLSVYLDTVEDYEPSRFFYVFNSFEEALAKAKEVIEWEGLDESLAKELESDWTAEYGDFGMLRIEEYIMGERMD